MSNVQKKAIAQLKTKIENNLNQKYGNFEVADSTFFATMLRAGYENSVGTWSRRNNGTVVYRQ